MLSPVAGRISAAALWRHKLDAVSWAGLQHSLYIRVRNFDLWRQRHGWRRHAEFLEPSFKSSRSKQDEHPHLLRVNYKACATSRGRQTIVPGVALIVWPPTEKVISPSST